MNRIIFSFFVFIGMYSYAQETIKLPKENEETLIKKIREKYLLINKQKESYQVEENFWSYENDELDNDTDYENNEEGNEEITTTIYMENAQKRLVVYYNHLYKYQVPYHKKTYSELYFWGNEIIFIYEKIIESLEESYYSENLEHNAEMKEGNNVQEKRFYFDKEKIFKVLRKDVEFTDEQDIDVLLSTIVNVRIDLDSLTSDDFSEGYNYYLINY